MIFYDERMESISEKIRKGEPVDFFEAIAAIDYQEGRRQMEAERKSNKWWRRLIRWATQPEKPQ